MAETFFVDSNVPLYAADERSAAKRLLARRWLEGLGATETGRVSWQVLHEFYWNATRRIGLDATSARAMVEELLLWGPVGNSRDLIRGAWRWVDEAHVAYWDALIVAAAERAGARYLLTEDLQAGRRFGGVRVVNPFDEDGAALLGTVS